MKKFLAFCLFIASCASHSNIFQTLDNEVKIHAWGRDNRIKAAIFEEIYRKHKDEVDFEQRLFSYLDSDKKYYWIGIYLNEPNYTNIGDFELSNKVLSSGLAKAADDTQKIKYLWVIGANLYLAGKKNEALPFLLEGYSLSQKYPGNKPAWSRDKTEQIYKFIEENRR